jgi:uncharacterized RDD family membrane protein YckC
MSTKSGESGVGGWLAWLVGCLMSIGPAVGLGELLSDFERAEQHFPNLLSGSAWGEYQELTWYVFACSVAISIYAGYRLWKVHVKVSVQIAVISLWLAGPISSLCNIAIFWHLFGAKAIEQQPLAAAVSLVVSVAGAAVWTAYLLRSVRVKNTYFGQSNHSQETISAELEYVGFWLRVVASLVDTVLVLVVTVPLMGLFGYDYLSNSLTESPGSALISDVLPAIVVIALWASLQATPGKMMLSARIVDAKTGGKPGLGQCLLRYLGYFVSIPGLGIGFLMVAFDSRKQGLHDMIAGTVVVRPKIRGTAEVSFSVATPPPGNLPPP